MNIRRSALALGAAAAFTISAPLVDAQMQGATVTTVPANSDVVASIPYNRQPVGEYETSSVSGSDITLAGSPDFDTNEFQDTHYVRVIDGSGAGLWSTISSNTSNVLTLGDSNVAAELDAGGDQTVRVYPHHTVSSVFPETYQGISFADQTQVLLFANDDTRQNLNPGGSDFATFNTGGFNPNTWSDPDLVIPPDTGIVVRNNGSDALTVIAQGLVPDHKVSYLAPGGDVDKDTVVSSGYPVDSMVKWSGFGGVDQRQILIYANGDTRQNLNPGGSGFATFNTGGFNPNTWSDADLILPAGEGFVLRQNGGSGGLIETTPIYPVVTE